jgi:hypothetical protein
MAIFRSDAKAAVKVTIDWKIRPGEPVRPEAAAGWRAVNDSA